MKTYFLLLIAILVVSCQKEGLSKDTGNVEITLPAVSWTYQIYTEEQFNRLLNYESAFAMRSGLSQIGKISEKELLKGNYGIHFYQNGTGYKRVFQVVANKVNKFTMP
jgi:hypothetical protein